MIIISLTKNANKTSHKLFSAIEIMIIIMIKRHKSYETVWRVVMPFHVIQANNVSLQLTDVILSVIVEEKKRAES